MKILPKHIESQNLSSINLRIAKRYLRGKKDTLFSSTKNIRNNLLQILLNFISNVHEEHQDQYFAGKVLLFPLFKYNFN